MTQKKKKRERDLIGFLNSLTRRYKNGGDARTSCRFGSYTHTQCASVMAVSLSACPCVCVVHVWLQEQLCDWLAQ